MPDRGVEQGRRGGGGGWCRGLSASHVEVGTTIGYRQELVLGMIVLV